MKLLETAVAMKQTVRHVHYIKTVNARNKIKITHVVTRAKVDWLYF